MTGADPQERGGATGEADALVDQIAAKLRATPLTRLTGRDVAYLLEALKSLRAQLAERDALIERLEEQARRLASLMDLSEDEQRDLALAYTTDWRSVRAENKAMRVVVIALKRYDVLLQAWSRLIDAGTQHLGNVPELDEAYADILKALAALDHAQRPHHAADAHTEGTQGTEGQRAIQGHPGTQATPDLPSEACGDAG